MGNDNKAQTIDWVEACRYVPTEEWPTEEELADLGCLEETVDNFIYYLEGKDFFTWEAIIREEQDLDQTEDQEEAIDDLLKKYKDQDTHEPFFDASEISRKNRPFF